MKAFKIIKQEKTTKDGKKFTTYLGIAGEIEESIKPFSFIGQINFYDVHFTNKFKSDSDYPKLESLKFPLTILNPIKIEYGEIKGDYYFISKKDKNGKYIYNKDGKKVKAIFINSYDKARFVNEDWDLTKNHESIDEDLPF